MCLPSRPARTGRAASCAAGRSPATTRTCWTSSTARSGACAPPAPSASLRYREGGAPGTLAGWDVPGDRGDAGRLDTGGLDVGAGADGDGLTDVGDDAGRGVVGDGRGELGVGLGRGVVRVGRGEWVGLGDGPWVTARGVVPADCGGGRTTGEGASTARNGAVRT